MQVGGAQNRSNCPASHSPVLLLLGSDRTSHLRLLGGKGGAESGPPRRPFYGLRREGYLGQVGDRVFVSS